MQLLKKPGLYYQSHYQIKRFQDIERIHNNGNLSVDMNIEQD